MEYHRTIMARILIITHAYDDYLERGYLLGVISDFWVRAGHYVSVVAGPDNWPDADIAVMHVDLSVVPPEYAAASRRYPQVLNGAVLDICKRRVSSCLLQPGDAWSGPVIIKTDLNCHGLQEWRLADIAKRRHAPAYVMDRYPVLESMKDVPEEVWQDPAWVVERFVPETDARGYWIRTWTFLGDGERCTRYLARQRVIKGSDIIASEPAPVPDDLRAERRRLGFDYGKFDFVVHEGKALLFDANRTPGPLSAQMQAAMAASNQRLAGGLDAFLAKGG